MKRPSIKLALAGCLVAMFAMTALLGYFSVSALNAIDKDNDNLVANWVPTLSLAKQMNIDLGDIRIGLRDHVLATNDDEEQAAEANIEAARQRYAKSAAGYEALLISDTERRQFVELQEQVVRWGKVTEKLLTASRENQDEVAKQVLNHEMIPIGKDVDHVIDALVAYNEQGANQSGANNQQTLEQSINLTYLVVGLAVALGVAAIIFALSQISAPINRITGAMRKLAEGDTASEIPFAGRNDEIGAMAGAVEVFRQAAISNKRLEQEAEESRKQAEIDRIAAQEKAEADATERLRIATSGLASGLKRLAAGDLSFQLTEAFAPDFEDLRRNFNQSIQQLGDALRSVTSGFRTIDSGTSEIASGASDLSKRTEQQAAALEETAAALDQITVNVTNSTQRTQVARSVAVKANQSATKSAEVVAQAEDAMQMIETSSEQISNIIGVIDEIAFQTNLLALNAGVEAARAGDAGKGFAVVAQEVRELAQRSANAAKEIKALIRNSTEEVSNGVRLVRDAGGTLKTIGQFIAEMHNHMESIATSATEQAAGLSQVNVAVNQMDQTTQLNAAMVEETTAASATLSNEVDGLRRLLQRFQLGGGSTREAVRLANREAPVESPARRMMGKVASAMAGGRHRTSGDGWSEF